MSMPMMAMSVLPSLSLVTKREPAGNTTQTDPRSQRIRESRTGRPDNEVELAAHLPRAACPHFACSRAPRPGWSHHTPTREDQQDVRAPPLTYPITDMWKG